MERTLAIIKPDAVQAGNVGRILSRLEAEGFGIVGLKRIRLTPAQAGGFYHVHRERPFFGSLVAFMSEGPVVVVVLERESAVAELRRIMGATDPAGAEPGTLRRELASSIERNAIHGSDSPASAQYEIGYFFSNMELAS